MGLVEVVFEYCVIVDVNNLIVEIENELNIIYKFIWDKYLKRFFELEFLVFNVLDYICMVKELGNSLDKCKNNENLQQIFINVIIMVVSVIVFIIQGQQLLEEELEWLEEVCDMVLELNVFKYCIYEYVEFWMFFIVFNLFIIIGVFMVVKIMGVVGGLINFFKMFVCNIMLFGVQCKMLLGFLFILVLFYIGYIYYSDIVQFLLLDLWWKVVWLVVVKCILVVCVDSFYESIEGKVGYELKDEIECKFDKWQELLFVKQVKLLFVFLDGQWKK